MPSQDDRVTPDPVPTTDTLRAEVRRFLAQVSPPAEVRRVMETEDGYDPALWRTMAGTLGLPALLAEAPRSGWRALAVVLEEMGRSLLCAPFLSTAVLATAAILESGDEAAQRDLMPALASGRLVATVALADDAGGWQTGGIRTSAVSLGGDGYALEGRKEYVLDGTVADVLIVPARTGDDLSLFVVEAGVAGLGRTAAPTMDQTRRLATIDLAGTPARRLGEEGAGDRTLRRVLDLGAIALAAEAVGGAQRCLEMAVAHALTRHQFGRPIGSFQAVKHACADMLVAVESARSAAGSAVEAAARGAETGDLSLAASTAKVCCSEAYFQVAATTVQLHGALGFSWQHDAHLYFKRATSSRLLLGDPAYHRRRLADRLGF